MDIRRVIKSKGIPNKQMEEKVKAVVEEKVESQKEVIEEKVEEVVKKIDEVADAAAEKVEDVAEVVISKVEEVVPGGAKIVEVVNEALVGTSFSCGCLGWKISVQKLPVAQK
jgi:hypothetical protein